VNVGKTSSSCSTNDIIVLLLLGDRSESIWVTRIRIHRSIPYDDRGILDCWKWHHTWFKLSEHISK
jgi:hypothetical protein